jgi:hypothetical protein
MKRDAAICALALLYVCPHTAIFFIFFYVAQIRQQEEEKLRVSLEIDEATVALNQVNMYAGVGWRMLAYADIC